MSPIMIYIICAILFCVAMHIVFKLVKYRTKKNKTHNTRTHNTRTQYTPYYINYTVEGEQKSIMLEPEVIDFIRDTDDIEKITNSMMDDILSQYPNISKKQLREELLVNLSDIVIMKGMKCI